MRSVTFKPLVRFKKRPNMIGFDVETQGSDNVFLCASAVSEAYKRFFTDKESLYQFFLNLKGFNVIVTTNLGFDFFASMKEKAECFDLLFKNGNLITAKTLTTSQGFFHKTNGRHNKLVFVDTLNYAAASVEKLGSLIGLPKLSISFLGRKPESSEEWEQLKTYNQRDAEISLKAMIHFTNKFYEAGSDFQLTIASTAMSIFRHNYLKDSFTVHPIWLLEKEFKAYYGGRCETFTRGKIPAGHVYDFNSMYPSVMTEKMPDPNSLYYKFGNNKVFLKDEGFSKAAVYIPKMKYPPLPFRNDGKLMFPTGTLIGWWPHNELRYAERLGCRIIKLFETIGFRRTCKPFVEYVKNFYEKKRTAQNENLRYVYKLLLNSLYGKFGQKMFQDDKWVHERQIFSDDDLPESFERVGEYFRFPQMKAKPSVCCFPCWPSYVTAYARIKLHKVLLESDADYCDTDSVMTQKILRESDDLGGLKLEFSYDHGILIKPKFYFLKSGEEIKCRCKGFGRMTESDFENLIRKGFGTLKRFTKFRESLRRKLAVNHVMMVEKNFSFEDNKRSWPKAFTKESAQLSEALEINQFSI
jgi:hypothetical protein